MGNGKHGRRCFAVVKRTVKPSQYRYRQAFLVTGLYAAPILILKYEGTTVGAH